MYNKICCTTIIMKKHLWQKSTWFWLNKCALIILEKRQHKQWIRYTCISKSLLPTPCCWVWFAKCILEANKVKTMNQFHGWKQVDKCQILHPGLTTLSDNSVKEAARAKKGQGYYDSEGVWCCVSFWHIWAMDNIMYPVTLIVTVASEQTY